MARALRLTKAERDYLKSALAPIDHKLPRAIIAKVEASEERAPGVDAGALERAMERGARGKLVKLEGAGYARASRQAGLVGATEDDAKLVGEWMARQGWLTSPMTLIDVLNKWHQWLPRARATQPPPVLAPGLGASDRDDGQGPAPTGQKASGGRRPPGLR